MSPQMERRHGESRARIRYRVRALVDDPEITIPSTPRPQAGAASTVRGGISSFFDARPAINAFALRGGVVGVNTGCGWLRSRSELAAVLRTNRARDPRNIAA